MSYLLLITDIGARLKLPILQPVEEVDINVFLFGLQLGRLEDALSWKLALLW